MKRFAMYKLLKTLLILLPIASGFAFADEKQAAETEDTASLRRIRIYDPENKQHMAIIRRYFRDGLPEGYKLRMEVELTSDSSQEGAVRELPVIVVPIDEDGLRNGTELHYRLWSPLQRSIEYKDDVKHGIERGYRYNPDARENNVVEEINWKDGKMHGPRRFFYPDGSVQMEAEFKDGQPVGANKSYSADGKLLEVTPYKDGEMHGERIQYWQGTDKLRRIIPYEAGTVEGTVKDFHENGKLRRLMPFRKGLLHGIEQEFDAEGKVIRERFWLEGEMVPRGRFEQEFE